MQGVFLIFSENSTLWIFNYLFMSGLELKDFLQHNGIRLTELSDKLNSSFQTLNSLFRAQDVKSGTLEKIAAAYGHDIGWFYGLEGKSEQMVTEVPGACSSTDTALLRALDEIGEQRKLTQAAQEQVSNLVQIISNITEK